MAFNDGLTNSDVANQHEVESILDRVCAENLMPVNKIGNHTYLHPDISTVGLPPR